MTDTDEALVERTAKAISDAWDDFMHAERRSDVDCMWRDGLISKDGAMLQARAVLADLREQGWKSPDDLAGYVLVSFSEPEQGRAVVYGHPGGDPHCVYPDGACTCPEGPLLTCPDCGQIHEWDDDTKERES